MERAYHGTKVAPARRLLRARPRYESFDVKLFECNYIFWFGPELPQALFRNNAGTDRAVRSPLCPRFIVGIFIKVDAFFSTCAFLSLTISENFKYNEIDLGW